MLTIKRVATVLSNYQEDADDKQDVGCGRNCLGNCCLPASMLPVYTMKKEHEETQLSFLNLLLEQWDDRMKRGLFRYDVRKCAETKIIRGKHGFIAQLNEGRHLKKRPTEFRIDQVLQPFDDSKFNFNKVGQEEVLFGFEQCNDKSACFSADDHANYSPNVIAINVSPIEYGHVLLIPHVLDCLPQRVDHGSFLLAIQMAKEAANPFFRVGYNSLGAFATINHLHFQAYYLEVAFPIEKAPIQGIISRESLGLEDKGVIVSELLDYPVRGLVFEGGKSEQDLSDVVATACVCLQNTNIAFNVLISNSGKRIFLLPQCYAEKQALGEASQEMLETQVNPAVWEISGHIVLKRRKDYDDASDDYASRLLAEVSLSKERFNEVKAYVLESAGFYLQQETNNMNKAVNETQVEKEDDDDEKVINIQEEDTLMCKQPAPSQLADHQHIPFDCLILQ